jgi:integrase
MELRYNKFREMIWIEGKLIKSPFFSRKTDARDWLANKRNERSRRQVLGDEYKVQTQLTIEEFASDWLMTKITPSRAESTSVNYERMLRCHIFPVLGKKKLKEIKTTDADKLLSHLVKNGMSPKGTHCVMTLLKQIMNEAERRDEIVKNHLRHYSMPKVPEKAHRYWSDDDINKFLLASRSHPYYPFFVCALYTGMRKGEIAALKWDSVIWQQNHLVVKGTLDRYGDREVTKSGRIRYVPMNQFLRSVLENHFKERKVDSPYVFTIDGQSIDTNHAYRVFSQLQKSAGIKNKIRVHDTRHTFASQFMMKGLGSLFELGKILGHSDSKMTQRYAHLSPEHMESKTKNLIYGSEKELMENPTPILPQKDFPLFLASRN